MISSPSDLPQILREALAAHEILRTLGFPADDIYDCQTPDAFQVILRSQGLEFVINLAWHEEEKRLRAWESKTAWLAAMHAWNETLTEANRQEILNSSRMRENAVSLIASLTFKGFKFRQDRAKFN